MQLIRLSHERCHPYPVHLQHFLSIRDLHSIFIPLSRLSFFLHNKGIVGNNAYISLDDVYKASGIPFVLQVDLCIILQDYATLNNSWPVDVFTIIIITLFSLALALSPRFC